MSNDDIKQATYSDMAEFVDAQLKERSVASIKLKDGRMIFFTKELLAQLLIKATESGRAVIFIESQVLS